MGVICVNMKKGAQEQKNCIGKVQESSDLVTELAQKCNLSASKLLEVLSEIEQVSGNGAQHLKKLSHCTKKNLESKDRFDEVIGSMATIKRNL